MAPMEATLGNWLLAAAPILVVLVLMLGIRWGGSKAGPAGWLAALLVSTLFFGAGAELLAYAQLRALLLAVYVLYIIWAALLLYHMVNEAGAIEAIGSQLTNLTRDQGKLVLLLGWTFGSFLQGASGFGVPAAVVAPLLVGLGIPAGRAVMIALVGHAWAVTYGSLASSFLALIAATGQSGADLTPWTAAMLAVAGYGCGAALLWAVGGLRGWLREFGLWALLGTLMGGVQFLFAWLGFYTIASFLAGLAGLGLIILILRRNAKNLPESCHSEELERRGISMRWTVVRTELHCMEIPRCARNDIFNLDVIAAYLYLPQIDPCNLRRSVLNSGVTPWRIIEDLYAARVNQGRLMPIRHFFDGSLVSFGDQIFSDNGR